MNALFRAFDIFSFAGTVEIEKGERRRRRRKEKESETRDEERDNEREREKEKEEVPLSVAVASLLPAAARHRCSPSLLLAALAVTTRIF